MPGRKYFATNSYRYGFNGKENDNDVKGEGNQQDYGMRIYDPRLGRFLSVDPLAPIFPWNSPYAYAEGDPVNYVDLDGLEKPEQTAQATTGVATKATQKVVTQQATKRLSNVVVNSSGKLAGKGAENWLLRGVKWVGNSVGRAASLTVSLVLSDGELASGTLPVEYKEKMIKANYERHTTDINKLTEFEKQQIEERIRKGEATAQDKIYAQKIAGEVAEQKVKKGSDDLVGFRRDHILNRHKAGAGKAGKTEFPSTWDDDRIINEVNKIANDPKASGGVGKYNSPYKTGIVDGVEIRVDFYPSNHSTNAGKVSTAYPTNLPANPK